VGAVVGVVAGWSRTAHDLVDPWISALYATPDVALIPLFILWLGVGIATNATIVFLAAVFSIVINVIAGVRSVDPDLLDVVKAFNASRWTVLRTIVLPTTVPFFLAGMRLASGRALVGVVVAEFVASSQGIGFMMSVAGSTLRTGRVMFGLLILGVFGMLLGELIGRLERRYDVWRPQPVG
jgi:NitT/TauT family transport system permease protein